MREDAKRWLEFAAKDLRAAEVLAEAGELDSAAYHVQQSIEKALKSVIIFLDLKLSPKRFRTHDIGYLISVLKPHVSIPKWSPQARAIARYAFEVRYPDDYVPISKEEYKEAYEIAKRVLEWAKEIVRP